MTSPAWIVMKASEKFYNPTTAINQLWQNAFTRLKITGWRWYYLSTVMDDYSRYIVPWRLCTGMVAKGCVGYSQGCFEGGIERKQRPRLLSDNGPCYVSGELKDWLKEHNMDHTHCKPYHPMTQGKIERWHRTMKDKILLDNYHLPGDLEQRCKTKEKTMKLRKQLLSRLIIAL